MSQPDESLNRLLDELELRARQRARKEESEDYWICQRRHPRNTFRSACNVSFFTHTRSTLANLPGRTRNLSRSGMGLLVRRVFRTGEPIEVEIILPDRPRVYLAGLVMFCRYAGRGYSEVGVSLRTVAARSSFGGDLAGTIEANPWMRPPVATA